jgi:hypothetical protein
MMSCMRFASDDATLAVRFKATSIPVFVTSGCYHCEVAQYGEMSRRSGSAAEADKHSDISPL